MKKINTALFCIFVLLFCSCDVLNKAPLDEIADDSFWSDETLVKYYVNDLYSEISVDGLQLQENRSDNSVSAQRDKYRASWFKFNYDMVSASDPQDDDVWEDYYVKVRKCNRFFRTNRYVYHRRKREVKTYGRSSLLACHVLFRNGKAIWRCHSTG